MFGCFIEFLFFFPNYWFLFFQLGPRNAVLFFQDDAKTARLDNLPDSFFEIGINDIQLMMGELKQKAEGTTNQPLMTAKLREMEEDQKQLRLLNKYRVVIIRVQFPNRYVLQGIFTPYETIEMLYQFVRTYLSNPSIEFYLCEYILLDSYRNIISFFFRKLVRQRTAFSSGVKNLITPNQCWFWRFNTDTTPPKNILPRESRLFEVNCVPTAVLHFGSDDKQTNYLKEDILEKLSSPKASLFQAFADRYVLDNGRFNENLKKTIILKIILKSVSSKNVKRKKTMKMFSFWRQHFSYRGIQTPSNAAPADANEPSTSQWAGRSNAASSSSAAKSDIIPAWFQKPGKK